jgi:5-methylcytosine-specific restriction endonuclease McrA
MVPLHSFKDSLFNLQTTSKAEAKRMWRQSIKDQWEHKCAYCESQENITLDHITPQCKGGLDIKTNVVACCHSCNQSKGHEHWKLWYVQQDFYSEERFDKIENWMKPPLPTNLYAYRPRRNCAS